MPHDLENITDQELQNEIIRRTKSKKGLPINLKCFYCRRSFWSRWNNTTQSHSKMNNLFYWTRAKKHQNKYICCFCLYELYSTRDKEFLAMIKVSKKLNNLSSYVSRGVVRPSKS